MPGTGAGNDNLSSALLAAFPPTLLSRTSPLLPQLVSLLRIYGSQVTAADIYYKVEAMLLSEKRPDGQQAGLSSELVEQLKKDLQREWEAKIKPKDAATPVSAVKQRSGLGSLWVSVPYREHRSSVLLILVLVLQSGYRTQDASNACTARSVCPFLAPIFILIDVDADTEPEHRHALSKHALSTGRRGRSSEDHGDSQPPPDLDL